MTLAKRIIQLSSRFTHLAEICPGQVRVRKIRLIELIVCIIRQLCKSFFMLIFFVHDVNSTAMYAVLCMNNEPILISY